MSGIARKTGLEGFKKFKVTGYLGFSKKHLNQNFIFIPREDVDALHAIMDDVRKYLGPYIHDDRDIMQEKIDARRKKHPTDDKTKRMEIAVEQTRAMLRVAIDDPEMLLWIDFLEYTQYSESYIIVEACAEDGKYTPIYVSGSDAIPQVGGALDSIMEVLEADTEKKIVFDIIQ